MSITKLELLEALEQIAPLDLAEHWDNCGMQVDLNQKKIEKVFVALEITEENLHEAIGKGVDFILTHHPLLFTAIKKVDGNCITGSNVITCIREGISVYSAHTNFDKAVRGNNFYLAQLLNLQNVRNFDVFGEGFIGVYGEYSDSMRLDEAAKLVKNKLKLKDKELRTIGNMGKEIRTVGICSGAGADMLDIAVRCGCDLFVTGDVKYHDGMKAKELGIAVLDAGHYGTEKIFVSNMAAQLKEKFQDRVLILESETGINPFDF